MTSGSERVVCPQCGSPGTHYWSDEGTHSIMADVPEQRANIRCDFCGGSLQPVTLPGVLLYHGTNATAAESIKHEGFMRGTWFARYKEDAVSYGGPYVFTVKVAALPPRGDGGEGDDDRWQFRLWDGLPVTAIVVLEKIEPVTLPFTDLPEEEA